MKVARAAGYSPRRFHVAPKMLSELRDATEQFKAWKAATKGLHLFSPSKGLFADWADWSMDRLLTAASEVASAEDWEAALRVLGLGGTDESSTEAKEASPTVGPFDDDAPHQAPPERYPEHVWIDHDVVWNWWGQHHDPDARGGMLGAIGLAIALDGAYRTICDISEAWARIDGSPIVVLERPEGDDPDRVRPILWLTTSTTGNDFLWTALDWPEMQARSARSAAWTLAPALAAA